MRRMFGVTVTIAVPNIYPVRTAYGKLLEHASLYGIPYHVSDSSYGTWLGIKRAEQPFWTSSYVAGTGKIDENMIKLIRKMMDKSVQEMRLELDRNLFK